MSKTYITSDQTIIVSGEGRVDYKVIFSKQFLTDRENMETIGKLVNEFGMLAFESSVGPGQTRSFTLDTSNYRWTASDSKKVEEELNIKLTELSKTLLAVQTAGLSEMLRGPQFKPPTQNSSSAATSPTQNSAPSTTVESEKPKNTKKKSMSRTPDRWKPNTVVKANPNILTIAPSEDNPLHIEINKQKRNT